MKTYFVRLYQDVTDPETYIFTGDMPVEQAFAAAESFVSQGVAKAELCERDARGTRVGVLTTFLRDDPERAKIDRLEALHFAALALA